MVILPGDLNNYSSMYAVISAGNINIQRINEQGYQT